MRKPIDTEQFKKTIESVKLGNYDLEATELKALIEMSEESLTSLVYDSYKWGFLKGSRSAKAEQKKARNNNAANSLES